MLSPLLIALAVGPADGARIYEKLCASCHGTAGQGSKTHDEPLVGDWSIDKLARYIEKNMPEDAPGTCGGAEARRVARYIHEAFYSPQAQARNRPPRLDLARLTVGQYRNAIADLMATFMPPPEVDRRQGLRGEYFNEKEIRAALAEGSRVRERLEAGVALTSETPPVPEVTADNYAIRWSGSLFAPETGPYELVVESDNGTRLWINGERLIDAWVRSGDQRVHRGTVMLLAGRSYPLRLEVFKQKKEPSVAIALRWKAPHHVEEAIPVRHLSPVRSPEVMIVQTAFPADDRSMGFERGTSVSKAWEEATTAAALEVTGYVLAQIPKLAGVTLDAPDARQTLSQFGLRVAERAFRRPLTPAQQEFFVARHFADGNDVEFALKKSLLLVLKSPRFLYREVGAPESDAYDVASRLSFTVWDSVPDQELLDSAATGRLLEEIAPQIDRMLADPRAHAKVRQFFHRWLAVDHLEDLPKDRALFPHFDEAVVSDLRTSLDLFLDEVIWSEASDFRQLLLADFVYLNGRLSGLYAANLAADASFQRVSSGIGGRAGILTHPLLMAGFAYDATTSPIHRGLFVARSLLGRRFRPPPDAVAPLSPALHPRMTTRERVALQTRPEICQGCHATINPLGFAFEHFDAVGRFRRAEEGKPIDASGWYATRAGQRVRFNGPRELGRSLARSEETQAAFIEQLFHFMVKQPILAHGVDHPETLRREFVQDGYSVRKLLVQIAATAASTKGATP